MTPITLFSFGYYGWGNSTRQLIEAVDAVELGRGFRRPIFVDVRIRRAGRARGFVGSAFEELLGPKRYRWMKELGNPHIVTHSGPRIQLAEPEAARELCELAIEAAADRRRVIFFCGCQWPLVDGRINCHRTLVAAETIRAFVLAGESAQVVEWPGGESDHIELAVDAKTFRAVLRGGSSLPPSGMPLAHSAGLAWGSTAKLTSGGDELYAVVGPAQFRRGQWLLPVFPSGKELSLTDACDESAHLRKSLGLVLLCTSSLQSRSKRRSQRPRP